MNRILLVIFTTTNEYRSVDINGTWSLHVLTNISGKLFDSKYSKSDNVKCMLSNESIDIWIENNSDVATFILKYISKCLYMLRTALWICLLIDLGTVLIAE